MKSKIILIIFLSITFTTNIFASSQVGERFLVPTWSIIPFIGILLSIAVFPLINSHWWENNYHKVSFFWIIVAFLSMFIGVLGSKFSFLDAFGHEMFHTYEEYISFIILLGSLFVVSGGIYIKGSISGKPLSNTIILAIGAILASFIGTTGAAMVLIRPLIRSIKWRKYKKHVIIFFIFLVCNIGGVLTPIGDPPLFIGFLNGIPFEWTFRLFPMWSFAVFILLVIFFIMDFILLKKENEKPALTGKKYIKIEGSFNFLFLLGILGAVIFSGVVHLGSIKTAYGTLEISNIVRDLSMVIFAILSVKFTKKEIHEANNFNFEPIKEVAYLFIGIFTTMIPALMLLNERGAELGVNTPSKFFWVTGILSSFLDNTPTYMTFLETAKGLLHLSVPQLLAHDFGVRIIEAISVGAVFMGANTYIGNGPNFMVKSISEQEKINMPSFFGYMLWSILILIPLFFVVDYIFFIK